jgi:hypothetical protein
MKLTLIIFKIIKMESMESFDQIKFKNKLIEYYEESKENIDSKIQIVFSLIQSIKEENTNFFSKGKL